MQGGTREDAIDLTRDDDHRRAAARAAAIDDDGDVIFTRERRARAGARRRRARAWDEDEDANAARDRPRRRARRRARDDDIDDDDARDDARDDDGRRARRARARRRARRAVRDRDASDSDDAEWDAWDARAAAAAADWNIVPFLDEMRAAAFNRFFHRDDGEPRDAPRALARDVLEERAPATRAARDAPTCAVCLEDPSPRQLVRELPCAHKFHKKCIDRWFRASSVCPTCRANVGPPPPRVDDAVADRGRANALGVYLQVVQALGRRFGAVPRRRR